MRTNNDTSFFMANDLQGDILPHRNGFYPPMDRNGVVDEAYRWPNGEVPYVFFVNNFGMSYELLTVHHF